MVQPSRLPDIHGRQARAIFKDLCSHGRQVLAIRGKLQANCCASVFIDRESADPLSGLAMP